MDVGGERTRLRGQSVWFPRAGSSVLCGLSLAVEMGHINNTLK